MDELQRFVRRWERERKARVEAETLLEEKSRALYHEKEEQLALIERLKETQSQLALAKKLKQAQSKLVQSEKMASLGRMVAGFAHEINTPIGVAVGAASHGSDAVKQLFRLLEQDEVAEEELEDGLATIGQAAELTLSNLNRAAELIRSFKRTSVDQSSEKSRVFNFQELIQDVINSLHNTFKRTQIAFVIECPEQLNLDGAPGVYTQVLTNLIMNSFIHAFAQGTEAGNIGIRVHEPSGSKLALEYWDNGAGMDEETQDRIFEPFFTTNRGDGGSGLGLYICYNIVTTQLAGSITCNSTPGDGVRFYIEHEI
ncbi:MAG: HAMP domain-containing histidine kinase [Gammaproteobacteria bacterium]|nr:HAMP domain-containing histidine kinase [Gammaproteobacteria bacterium]